MENTIHNKKNGGDKLSVVVITFNEEKNIRRCLESVKNIADEIIVVDSYSVDSTESICREYGVRFFRHEWLGFAGMKNYANRQATYDYVFSIDADEQLSRELENSILLMKSEGLKYAYTVNRLNSYAGKWIRHAGWYPDTKVRLWNKKEGSWEGNIHEHLHFTQDMKFVGLKGDLLHYSYTGIEDHLNRANRYTTLIAEDYYRKGKKASFFKMIFSSGFTFFKDYILRLGFMDGWRGLAICRIAAHSTFLKYAKLRELHDKIPEISLIITTYNRPEALELVLISVMKQKYLPSEVVVADDGSTEETGELIRKYQALFPVPLYHCRQDDEGFRLSQIRNKAIARSSGDYIIMVDGDMVLHPGFIRDHIDQARAGQFIQGSRVLLDDKITGERLHNRNVRFTPFSAGIKNRMNACRFRSLSGLVSPRYGKKDYRGVRGCNMSFWKEDLIRVNGFNEDFKGWGREDSEFVVRMLHHNIRRKNVKFGAVAYHLWHQENNSPNSNLDKNQAILDQALKEKRLWCGKGLDQYL